MNARDRSKILSIASANKGNNGGGGCLIVLIAIFCVSGLFSKCETRSEIHSPLASCLSGETDKDIIKECKRRYW